MASSQFIADNFIERTENGGRISRLDALRVAEVFLQTPYKHFITDYSRLQEGEKQNDFDSGEIANEDTIEIDFKQILTDEVREVIEHLDKWFHGKYRFCDLPMEHLWLELLLYQLGHPYHTNVGNHKRYSYRAKTRRMCIDIFTLDKCRALYDWMPMLEYFIHDMQDNNRQMITRMCIDAIDKQLLHIVDEIYYGAALVGINEFGWSRNFVLPKRVELTIAPTNNSLQGLILGCIKNTISNVVNWWNRHGTSIRSDG